MAEEEVNIEQQLKGVMEFYVRTYFQVNKEKFLEHARKMNVYGIDPDMVETKAEQYLEYIIEEASSKFHDIAYIVLNALVRLKEGEVRSFELRFLDLMERTLLKDVKEDDSIAVMVIGGSPPNSEDN